MNRSLRVLVLLAIAALGPVGASPAGADAPAGQMTLAHGISMQLMHEKALYAPLLELAIPGGYGPRVAESAIGLITNMSSSALRGAPPQRQVRAG